jgi:cellulose synthase/poly-beta-1,6-N-acetylglucosamine synthase-like glycosyltransferase
MHPLTTLFLQRLDHGYWQSSPAHRGQQKVERSMRSAAQTTGDVKFSASVIVPVKNEREMIDACLKSLLDLDYDQYEIIIVDTGSTDGTAEIVERIAQSNERVRLLRTTGYAADGRNAGIQAATGVILGFTDGDCVVPKDWLKRLATCLLSESHETAGVGGPNIPVEKKPNLWSTIINRVLQSFVGSAGSVQVSITKREYVRSLSTANSVFWADKVRQQNGFDHRLYFCEDADFCARMVRAGYRLRFVKDAEVYHARDYHSLGNFGRHMFRYGRTRGEAISIKPRTNLTFTAIAIFSFLLLEILLFMASLEGIRYTGMLFVTLMALYAILIVATSLVLAKGFTTNFLPSVLAFFVLHAAYSSGLIAGLFTGVGKTLGGKWPA